MDILVIESNKRIRDQIVVGLQNFPEFAVETGEGFGGLNLTRGKDFDAIFLGTTCGQDCAGMQMLENFRTSDTETDVILVTSSKKAKSHHQLRARYDVLSMLYCPIEPRDFFRLVARLRRREVGTTA